MNEQMTPVFICPTLVGRHLDLTALHMLLGRKGSGSGQAILIAGEAGIGKSRLVAEVKGYASRWNFQILEGQCFQADSMLPYVPLLDLFLAHFSKAAAVSDGEKVLLSELSRLLPDFAMLFPDLASQPARQFTDSEQEKRWLFAAMTRFLSDLAAHAPTLLIIEDIHWCDDLSLEFLLHLVRRSQQLPLLLLMTYRHNEPGPALRQWLAQVERQRLAQEFLLEPLSQSDVSAMLRAMLGTQQEIDADLLDTLYTLSEGNPFFVEELLKSLVTTRELVRSEGTWTYTAHQMAIPRSVQEAVQQRMLSLSTDARRLLMLAAIAGRRFNVTLLQHIMRCDEAQLLSLLKEMMAAQLIIEESAEQFAFRHALTQQAIAASLLLRERQMLHGTLAEALEQLSTSTSRREKYLGDLAFHSYEAGRWEQALLYERQVGERALKLYAQRAAIDHFTRAIDASQHLFVVPPSPVYRARGQAYETLGEFNSALDDYERALDAAVAARDEREEWQSIMSLGFLWAGRDYKQAGDWFRRALDHASRLADPGLRARSLNRLGNWLVNTGQAEEGLRAHQEALDIFKEQEDAQGMAETYDLLGTAYGLYGDCVNAAQQLGEAIALFRMLKDDQGLAASLAMRGVIASLPANETCFYALRTREEFLQDATESLRLARQFDSLSQQAFAEFALSEVYCSFNEFSQAIVHANEGLRIATAIEHQQWMIVASQVLGTAYFHLLQPTLAQATLSNALHLAQPLGSAFLTGTIIATQGLVSLQEHHLAQAETQLATFMSPEQLPRNMAERQIAWVWGELALVQNKPDRALERAEYLLNSAPGDQRTQPIPYLLKLKGEALAALSRFEEAMHIFEGAKHGARMHHNLSLLWRIHISCGHLYRRLKRDELAQQEYIAAKQNIEALASRIEEDDLREHFLRTALSSLPQERVRSPQQTAKRMFNGLTEREREVAVLVAQGCTNGDIAIRLVMSERTAESHVSNILSKLGFTSRAQIAAWAVEKGLNGS